MAEWGRAKGSGQYTALCRKLLDGVKRVLKESLVMPLRYPEYFTGLLQPWKGVLLYGPPGTGKTLLVRTLAAEARLNLIAVAIPCTAGTRESCRRRLALRTPGGAFYTEDICTLTPSRVRAGPKPGQAVQPRLSQGETSEGGTVRTGFETENTSEVLACLR